MWNINKLSEQRHFSAFSFLPTNIFTGGAELHCLLPSRLAHVTHGLCVNLHVQQRVCKTWFAHRATLLYMQREIRSNACVIGRRLFSSVLKDNEQKNLLAL